MSKVTTRPATLTESQARRMLDGGKGVREVLVDGVVVGQYAKNKHGVTIGHFDPQALVAEENPFAAARLSHSVRPTVRGRRKTSEVVADIAAQHVGRYERYIKAAGLAHKLSTAGMSHSAIYFAGPCSVTQADAWVERIEKLAAEMDIVAA